MIVDGLVLLLLLLVTPRVHLISALMFLDEARVQEDHTFVHDLEMRSHEVEITYEFLVYQGFDLVCAADLNHKALILTLQVLRSHHKVTINLSNLRFLPGVSGEDFDVIGTVTKVAYALEMNLAFHGLVRLLPILLLLSPVISQRSIVPGCGIHTFLVKGHRGIICGG